MSSAPDDEAVAMVAGRIAASKRYRGVEEAVVRRLAREELPRAASPDDAVKRVKRRLHQAFGAFQPGGSRGTRLEHDLAHLLEAASSDGSRTALRAVCRELMARHASTRERLTYLEGFYPAVWEAMGATPGSILDLGCGLAPLALPWMEIPSSTTYGAVDVDRTSLALVDSFLGIAGQPHVVLALDLAGEVRLPPSEVALLLKLVPILDRQEANAAARLMQGLESRHAVVSFPVRSLGGRARGMERTYRRRFETLMQELGPRVAAVAEASVPNELVFVVALASRGRSAGG
jgi:16S rRNA (guanine(1405)-N(7))-methyltransferase